MTDRNMAVVSTDGTVTFDWDWVEQCAKGAPDGVLWGIAKVLLEARNVGRADAEAARGYDLNLTARPGEKG